MSTKYTSEQKLNALECYMPEESFDSSEMDSTMTPDMQEEIKNDIVEYTVFAFDNEIAFNEIEQRLNTSDYSNVDELYKDSILLPIVAQIEGEPIDGSNINCYVHEVLESMGDIKTIVLIKKMETLLNS